MCLYEKCNDTGEGGRAEEAGRMRQEKGRRRI